MSLLAEYIVFSTLRLICIILSERYGLCYNLYLYYKTFPIIYGAKIFFLILSGMFNACGYNFYLRRIY